MEHRSVSIPPCQQYLIEPDNFLYHVAKTMCFIAFAELYSHQPDDQQARQHACSNVPVKYEFAGSATRRASLRSLCCCCAGLQLDDDLIFDMHDPSHAE